jgi:hypothetical protein
MALETYQQASATESSPTVNNDWLK